ncbi:MAG: nucleotide exchange factor GrpE [Bifidobacteriaceae bacterium]|jgi:molecular chaperone GrpE|nr:nucleotide exchange factor GrpE [Bifidobacteriaceae bacterium]
MTKATSKNDLEKALKDTQKELTSYMEELAKERASFINYRNRAVEAQETARFFGKKDALGELLPVLDDIQRAKDQKAFAADSPFGAIVQKLESSLEKIGVKSFGEKGQIFDHKIHEAILSHEDPKTKQETIDAVIEKGYKINDTIIRPARVSVAIPKELAEKTSNNNNGKSNKTSKDEA